MKRFCLLALAVLSGAPVIAHDYDPAMPVLRMYTSAFAANDCEMVWRLTSSAVKRRDQTGQTRDMVCGLIAKMQAAHFYEATSEPIAYLRDGNRHAVFVPTKRITKSFNWAPESDSMYIVHSQDDGATWEVLDLGCVDERWVREVFPAYRGQPRLPVDRAKAFEYLPW